MNTKSNKSDKPKRKAILPLLQLTRVVEENHPGAIAICHDGEEPYYVAPLTHDDPQGYGVMPKWVKYRFPAFPVPLSSDGIPWEPGVVHILTKLQEAAYPNMGTFSNQAHDLGFYCQTLQAQNIDWMKFPKNRLLRPTYRFRGALDIMLGQRKIGRSLASRSMSSVVAMYRRLKGEGVFTPEFNAWEDRERFITYEDQVGRPNSQLVKTTDLAVSTKTPRDVDYIYDGEKMKPLEWDEQETVFRALAICGNTEVNFMHLIAVATGARLQTVCTMRLGSIRSEMAPDKYGNVLITAGPGTGIDTKFNKVGNLHFPVWLVEALRVYAESERAQRRRELNGGGDGDDQFLFLTKGGHPFYDTKDVLGMPGTVREKRYLNRGGAVQEYIRDFVLPVARQISGNPDFHYTFHWLRATFGMNLLEAQIELVNAGKLSLPAALGFVQERMWHKNVQVTLQYLNFKSNKAKQREVQMAFEEHLKTLASIAMKGNMNEVQ